MKKIKVGDNVKIMSGKDKGKEGKVLSVNNDRVVVESVNFMTKHAKPSQENPEGGIIKQEAALDISNVMFIHKGEVTRIGFTSRDGKNGTEKVRFAKSTGDIID